MSILDVLFFRYATLCILCIQLLICHFSQILRVSTNICLHTKNLSRTTRSNSVSFYCLFQSLLSNLSISIESNLDWTWISRWNHHRVLILLNIYMNTEKKDWWIERKKVRMSGLRRGVGQNERMRWDKV